MIVECRHCDELVDATYIGGYERTDKHGYPDTVQLQQCPRCLEPILASVNDIVGDGEFYVIYPNDTKVSASVPAPIRAAFEEAVACLRGKAYTATSIMCRKTLEGMCREHQVKRRNLVEALQELRERGVIESRLFEWADALRIQGNEAAHDLSVTTSAQDARDVLDFTHALLEYVFTFRDKFDAFKNRRSR